MVVFIAISKTLLLYFSFDNLGVLLLFLTGFILEILLGLYFFKFFEVYKKKFVFFKFSNLDYFLFSVMIYLLAFGLFSFDIIEKHLGLFVLALTVIFSLRIFPIEKTYIVTSMVAVGAFSVTFEYLYLLFMILSSVSLINFKDVGKYWFVCFSSVVFAIMVFIFKLFTFFEYFSLIFAVFCFVCMPQKLVSKWQNLFEQDAMQIILSKAQTNKIESVSHKLEIMSQTLLSMHQNFKMLLVGKIDRKCASAELVQDVINRCCKDCENYRFCFMQNINKKQMLGEFLLTAIDSGGVDENRLNNGMQTYCMKKSILINEVNQIASWYLSYEKAMKTEDESKLIVASELNNFSNIFSNFAKIAKKDVKINKNSSKILKESLLNGLIDAKEVLIFENENGLDSVCVVASNETLIKTDLLEVIEKNIRNKMKLKEINHLEFSGLGLATFIPTGRFRLDVAVSSKAKDKRNGDNVVVSKIGDNKYFVAIADGMGHGEGASKTSSMVLSLIKSMFEVGIDDELVVESVNKLLVPAGLDGFSTLDACVVDIEKETATFIKMGASVSVIKHKNTSDIVVSKSLPIGVIQNIKPTITKVPLILGDVLFLASDGVVDSFASIEEFKAFINDTKIYNLQKHLDNIIFDAEYQSKHLDDMTIIGINLLKNSWKWVNIILGEIMLEYLIDDKFVSKEDKIAVGVSGGADSMVLLWGLLDKQKEIGFDLHVININHHIRGKESDDDSLFVEKFCKDKKIKHTIVDVDVKKLKADQKMTLEESARKARYDAFYKIMKKEKLNKLFLAHHKNDQVETILMHILRGSGISGACGMKDSNVIFRPLLNFDKKQILKIADEHGIKFVNDETNDCNEYSRNYLRNVVIPAIEQKYPKAVDAIFEFGKKCKNVQKYIENNVKNENIEINDGFILLKDVVFQEDSVLIREYIKRIFEMFQVFADVEAKHYEMIVKLSNAKVNTCIDLPHDICAGKTYAGIKFFKKTMKTLVADAFDFSIGEIKVGENKKIICEFVEADDVVYGEGVLYADYGKISTDAVWRTRRVGDVFAKLGTGSKKLNDYFTDKKIENLTRDDVFVLATSNQVLVVAGHDVSEKVKIDGETEQIVAIKLVNG